ncbi:MAG: hypothetical protein WDO24_22375 [Pseudomonadota bacterium]
MVATEPNITHILLAVPGTGRQLMTTARPMGTPLPNLLSRDMLNEAARRRRPMISGIVSAGRRDPQAAGLGVGAGDPRRHGSLRPGRGVSTSTP